MGRGFRAVIGLLLISAAAIIYVSRHQAHDSDVSFKIIPFFAVPGLLLLLSSLLFGAPQSSRGPRRQQEAPSARWCGTGVGLIDYRAVGRGQYEATRWFTLLYLPLIPGPTWIIRPRGSTTVDIGVAVMTSHSFDFLGEKDTPPLRVLRTYVVGFLSATLVLGPLALVLWSFNELSPDSSLSLTLAALVPPLGLLWYLWRREARVFAPREPPRSQRRPTKR